MSSMKKKILIVDDAEINRMYLYEIFNDDYDITMAKCGQEALEAINNGKSSFDVILLDLVMPDIDGFDVLKKLKSNENTDEIPVIIVTTADSADSKVTALDLGAADIIVKPFNPVIIRHRVKNIIDLAEKTRRTLRDALFAEQTVAQNRLKKILDNIQGYVALVEISNLKKIIYQNRSFKDFAKFKGERINSLYFEYIAEEDKEILADTAKRVLAENKSRCCEVRMKDINGRLIWMSIQCARISYPDIANPVLLVVCTDITRLKEDEAELLYRANYDILTGIYNRTAFFEKTREMLKNNNEETFVIIRINIEHFKIMNDIFGTDMGDTVLRRLANTLRLIIRENGTFGRLQSDHFVACMPYKKLNTNEIFEKIQAAFKETEMNYSIVTNMGIYIIDDIMLPIAQMCDRAKLAMQTVKGNYLKRFAFYDDKIRKTLIKEQEITSEMNTAIEGGQFQIYLQPIYSLVTNSPVSAETLIRWVHPKKGIIQPSLFIPFFEKNGFIAKLDYYVWDTACRFLKKRRDSGKRLLPISVNISRLSLYNPNLCADMVGLIEKYDIPVEMLKLEITESAYMDNPDQLLKTVTELKSKGFIILMDDFGSGYSSLNTLKDIPVDILKIDMKFLGGLETSERAGNILTSVIRMAKWLKMPVVAEGVETKAELDYLRSIGCDNVQGYYYSKPLPIDKFEEYIDKFEAMPIELLPFIVAEDDFDLIFNGNQLVSRILNSVIGGIGIYELVGDKPTAIRVNDGYHDIMGYNPGTFFADSENLDSRLYEEDREILVDACKRAASGEKIDKLILRRYKADNSLLYLEFNITCLGKREDNPIICLAINDVTAVKENEILVNKHTQKIEHYHNFLDVLYNTLTCGICQYDYDTMKIITANDACNPLFGFANRKDLFDAFNEDFENSFGGEYKRDFENAVKQCLETKKSVIYETVFVGKDKNTVYLKVILDIVETVGDKKIIQTVFINITEEKQTEYNKKLSRYCKALFSIYMEIYELDYVKNTSKAIVNDMSNETKIIDDYEEYQKDGNVNDLSVILDHWTEKYIFFTDRLKFKEFIISRGQKEKSVEIRIVDKENAIRWISFGLIKIESKRHLLCIKDITEEKKAKMMVDESHLSEHFKSIYQMFANETANIPFEYNIVTNKLEYYLNDYENKVTVEDFSEVVKNSTVLFPGHKKIICELIEKCRNSVVSGTIKYMADYMGTGRKWYLMEYESIADDTGMPCRIKGKSIDMQNQLDLISELKNKAFLDTMTQVYNKATFEEIVNDFIMYNGDNKFAFFVLDIDYFKQINDTYGHPLGDEVIKGAADIMKKEFSDGTLIGRVGGDEFAAFMKYEDKKECVDAAERILKNIGSISEKLQIDTEISISIGIALYPKDGDSFNELFAAGDMALYKSKEERGKFTFVQ